MLLLLLLMLVFGADGAVLGAMLDFCDGVKGDGRSAARNDNFKSC